MNTTINNQYSTFYYNLNFKAKSINPITIKNFHEVDSTLLRGAKPTQAQLQELKDNGVKTIISFCTNYNPQNPQTKTPPEEANWAKNLGIKFHWLPFQSTKNPKQSYIDNFFNITDEARKKKEKVFIHCRHGADRTGLFSAIYRLRNQDIKLSDVIKELMAYGHDANHNKNIIPFIIDFKETMKAKNKFFDSFKNLIKKEIPNVKKLLRK